MNLDLTCQVCGKSFQRPAYRMKEGQKSYCSPACQNKGRQITVKIFCATCGKEFAINPSRVRDTFNFCSPECFYESRKISYGETPFCACGCGLPVTRDYGGSWHKFIHGHNFTGIKHSTETREKLSQKAQARSTEQSQRIMGANNPMFKHGKTQEINTQRVNWWERKKLRHIVLSRDASTCQKCFLRFPNHDLQLHHKDNNVANNELSNLVTLCAKCHHEVTFNKS